MGLNLVWSILSSLRTTAVLATLLAAYAGIAAVVPQGREALALAASEGTGALRVLAAWGLTNLFEAPWLKAFGVLLAVNAFSVLFRQGMNAKKRASLDLPATDLEAVAQAELPERAAEVARLVTTERLGAAPLAEKVEGAKVTMVFDTTRRAQAAPLLAHLGLVVLVLGAGWALQPAPLNRSLVRAILEVKDSRTQTVGRFDMAQGETFQFFQWRPKFVVRDFVPSKNGLGPAIRMEEIHQDEQRVDDFWIYLRAPEYRVQAGNQEVLRTFDEVHRKGLVSIRALKMGLVPMPGAGLSSSRAGILLLLGLGLLVFGAASGSGAHGRLWVVVDGDRVRFLGVPATEKDPRFAAMLQQLAGLTTHNLKG